MTVRLQRLAVLFVLLCPAAAAQPLLLVQGELGDLRPAEVTGHDWSVTSRGELANLFCATRTDASARIALASQTLTRRQRDSCVAANGGRLIELLIGRRAVLAVTAGESFGLTPELLYRALVRDVPGPDGALGANHAIRWRDLGAALPDAQIRVLLPPVDTVENRIVAEILLYEGCATSAATVLPADPIKRMALCTTVRADSTVARSDARLTVSAWLRSQGGAAIALVGVAALLAESELDAALPLDGVTPSFANIADGRYRAALPVYLLSVLSPGSVRTVASIAGPLLAESTLGPLGKLPRLGLAPLAAPDRVKLRLNLGREFENVTD